MAADIPRLLRGFPGTSLRREKTVAFDAHYTEMKVKQIAEAIARRMTPG